jgi:DNA-binding response OmpR family regulator
MKKVLIVEDESTIIKALSSKLESDNLSVLLAVDGEEGLSKALSEHPDLILLDLIMPKMDGLTMLAKLREDKWGKQVPVIILTNLTDAKTETEAMKKGVHEYLIKTDWTIEDVMKKVNEKLGIG